MSALRRRRPPSQGPLGPRSLRAAAGAVTELHISAYAGDTALLQRLVAGGANVSARDAFHLTPLHFAARQGHPTAVRLLLGAGAGVDVKDNEGWTPAHDAARHGHGAVLHLLLEAGADANVHDLRGSRPIDIARMWEQQEAEAVLEEWHARHSAALSTSHAPTAAEPAGERVPCRVTWGPDNSSAGMEAAGSCTVTATSGDGSSETLQSWDGMQRQPRVDEALAQLAALLGTGESTVANLGKAGVLSLAQASALTVGNLASASGLPLGAASELLGAVLRAQEMLHRPEGSVFNADPSPRSLEAFSDERAPSAASGVAWRFRKVACMEAMDPQLILLLDGFHAASCAARLPTTVGRPYAAIDPTVCTCGYRDAAAAVLLGEGVYTMNSLSRLTPADLEKVGLRPRVAAALCSAMKRHQHLGRLASPTEHSRWLPPSTHPIEIERRIGASTLARKLGKKSSLQSNKGDTRPVYSCNQCGLVVQSAALLQRHCDERRQHGSCVVARQMEDFRRALLNQLDQEAKSTRNVTVSVKRPMGAKRVRSASVRSSFMSRCSLPSRAVMREMLASNAHRSDNGVVVPFCEQLAPDLRSTSPEQACAASEYQAASSSSASTSESNPIAASPTSRPALSARDFLDARHPSIANEQADMLSPPATGTTLRLDLRRLKADDSRAMDKGHKPGPCSARAFLAHVGAAGPYAAESSMEQPRSPPKPEDLLQSYRSSRHGGPPARVAMPDILVEKQLTPSVDLERESDRRLEGELSLELSENDVEQRDCESVARAASPALYIANESEGKPGLHQPAGLPEASEASAVNVDSHGALADGGAIGSPRSEGGGADQHERARWTTAGLDEHADCADLVVERASGPADGVRCSFFHAQGEDSVSESKPTAADTSRPTPVTSIATLPGRGQGASAPIGSTTASYSRDDLTQGDCSMPTHVEFVSPSLSTLSDQPDAPEVSPTASSPSEYSTFDEESESDVSVSGILP